MQTLPDGSYDVIVVDAEPTADGDVRVELTITLGPQIGRVVALRGHQVRADAGALPDPVALMGIPGTLRVKQGVPEFRPECQ